MSEYRDALNHLVRFCQGWNKNVSEIYLSYLEKLSDAVYKAEVFDVATAYEEAHKKPISQETRRQMNLDESVEYLYNLAFEVKKLELKDDNWHGLTKALFNSIKNDKGPIFRLDKEIAKKKMQYEDISRPYVRGEHYGGDGGGTPINSYHQSAEEQLHIERFNIEKEISDLTIQQCIKEEQLKNEIEAFKTVCYSLRNSSMSEALIMRYLDGMFESDIADQLDYTLATIETYISQGVKNISKLLKNYKKV